MQSLSSLQDLGAYYGVANARVSDCRDISFIASSGDVTPIPREGELYLPESRNGHSNGHFSPDLTEYGGRPSAFVSLRQIRATEWTSRDRVDHDRRVNDLAWKRATGHHFGGPSPRKLQKKGTSIRYAASLDDLCRVFGLPKTALAATVDYFAMQDIGAAARGKYHLAPLI